ncbi:hypothetical protein SCLCIDRAFT_1222807 [Scleroderma citrinum Foug A]|uniref:Uncharacterized protein n=1 Tax=Scleroderma citrinum Foug A TaxID=1036808 RepID=A0A0C2ZL63_9AGAM|nr:hypothetical protein SCLCIDRAFT_1222807 [Scleroderma citrinum Foug A]
MRHRNRAFQFAELFEAWHMGSDQEAHLLVTSQMHSGCRTWRKTGDALKVLSGRRGCWPWIQLYKSVYKTTININTKRNYGNNRSKQETDDERTHEETTHDNEEPPQTRQRQGRQRKEENVVDGRGIGGRFGS